MTVAICGDVAFKGYYLETLYIFRCKLLLISICYILKQGNEFSAWRSEQYLLPLMKMPQLQAGVAGMKILQLKLKRVS